MFILFKIYVLKFFFQIFLLFHELKILQTLFKTFQLSDIDYDLNYRTIKMKTKMNFKTNLIIFKIKISKIIKITLITFVNETISL